MNKTEHETHPFIAYLQSQVEQRGVLASLRRGLGQPPGSVIEMYRYIIPWVPTNASASQEAAYYLIASLYALHRLSASSGNLGGHLAQSRREGGEEALERRFTALLSAHSDDLSEYLRQAVSYLKSNEIAINWEQLFYDIQNWNSPDRRIQKAWARAFWSRPTADQDSSQ